MIRLNPLDVFLWTVRRNEKDIVKLYNSLSPVMLLATGGTMLNFGYWNNDTPEPISAQENLCNEFGTLAELNSAKNMVDLGSGLSAPALFWHKIFPNLDIYCVNINLSQLSHTGPLQKIEFLNSTSTLLPFSKETVDRVLALESSQHFRPFSDFISESRRILKPSGILALALPVTLEGASISKLGLLNLTWSSEHYSINKIRNILKSSGFKITKEILIGKSVYDPLADYYTKNRQTLRKLILQKYSSYVEQILFLSLQKMKKSSENRIIDYVLFKCIIQD